MKTYKRCKICGKILGSSSNINGSYTRHFMTHGITEDYEQYLEDYENKCKTCGSPVKRIGNIFCSRRCRSLDLVGKTFAKKQNDNTRRVECRLCGWTSTDCLNTSGALTRHCRGKHGLELGNNLFKTIDAVEDTRERFKCPICGWTTTDVNNVSGCITVHLSKKHNMTIFELTEQYDIPTNEKTRLLESYYENQKTEKDRAGVLADPDNRIKCGVCGKLFMKISNTHIKTHGMTMPEYRKKYGRTVSDRASRKRSAHAIEINKNMVHKYSSKAEEEISSYIRDILNIGLEQNNRRLLNGKELDIYVPSKKLAIEYNGLLWHSEFFGHKTKDYHWNKTEKCDKMGIRLIHIFDDEWRDKSDLVKALLKRILVPDREKIYDDYTINIISKKDEEGFSNRYHIRGSAKGKIKIGLMHNNKLVSVMVLNKLRSVIKDSAGHYELVRFASTENMTINAKILFNYFVENYKPIKIIGYADRRWSQGGLYDGLGFYKTSNGSPNYWYVRDHIERIHRYNFRKSALKHLPNYSDDKTEIEIMLEAGYDRIWDCGSLKYEYIVERGRNEDI